MNRNQIVILNGNDIQEFKILKNAVDSNGEPFYFCENNKNKIVAISIKEVDTIKKIGNVENFKK